MWNTQTGRHKVAGSPRQGSHSLAKTYAVGSRRLVQLRTRMNFDRIWSSGLFIFIEPEFYELNVRGSQDKDEMSSKPLNTENSPELEPGSPSTAVTTPEDDGHGQNDIWESDSTTNIPTQDEMLSDLPTVKRQHMTDGYREGLAVGKARVMQQGFDDGYPIGVQIALRVGLVLGVLEGYLAAKSRAGARSVGDRAALQRVYDEARRELACPALLSGVDDEVVAGMTGIPPSIEVVISRWEVLVLGDGKEVKS